MLRTRSALCLVALGTLALGACGSDDDSGDAAGTTAPAAAETTAAETATGATLSISGRAFSSVTAVAGAPITIVNDDGFGHTVTDRDGGFSVSVGGGATAELTIDVAGTYKIFCEIHPDMAGTIVVN